LTFTLVIKLIENTESRVDFGKSRLETMHDTETGPTHDCLKLGEDFELDLRAYQ